ncbi:MAG: nickel pincer cofactor biosynthesis protein LarB [Candidatus Omnitrophota bacterium]
MRNIKRLLERLKSNKISVEKAMEELKSLPFRDLGFAKLDCHRSLRCGFPEVVYGEGKTVAQLAGISLDMIKRRDALLITRVSEGVYRALKKRVRVLRYDKLSRLAYVEPVRRKKSGLVVIVTAGTSDERIAREAELTCRVMGADVKLLCDVGVAGIHRVLKYTKLLQGARAIIVVAGMEGALASVVGGLVSKPVIAVPTSVGYGASFRGIAPLLTMLNSCAPGVVVVNIDNGFGAGYFAAMITGQAG